MLNGSHGKKGGTSWRRRLLVTPLKKGLRTVLRRADTPTLTKLEGSAMEDDCWSIEALRNVNSLAASVALKKNLRNGAVVSYLKTKENTPDLKAAQQ